LFALVAINSHAHGGRADASGRTGIGCFLAFVSTGPSSGRGNLSRLALSFPPSRPPKG
jgi:hypothetical protein